MRAKAALVKDYTISQIVAIPAQQSEQIEKYMNEIGMSGNWIAAHNSSGREYSVGSEWNESALDYLPKNPYKNGTWDGKDWVPPIPCPDVGEYFWDDEQEAWVQVSFDNN